MYVPEEILAILRYNISSMKLVCAFLLFKSTRETNPNKIVFITIELLELSLSTSSPKKHAAIYVN